MMPTSPTIPGRPADPGESALRTGRVMFGRYRLEQMVGRGGMGVVWRAFDTKLDRPVALKFLPDLLFMDVAARDDLKRETRRSLDLTHPHIVRIHDFVDDDQVAAISMEYVDGATLSQRRVEQPERFFECEALHGWTQALCQALDYAHYNARCVHRDLKPSNLMITSRGVLKVADFGIACGLHHTAARVSALNSTGGTLGYMSPQQLTGELASPSDDIYSIGATLYELLTGKPPFYCGDLTYQIRSVEPDTVSRRRAKLGLRGRPIDPRWEETIAACLAKDPQRRPSDVQEVGRRLGVSASHSPDVPPTIANLPDTVGYPPVELAPPPSTPVMPLTPPSSRRTGSVLADEPKTEMRPVTPSWLAQNRTALIAGVIGLLAVIAVWFRPHSAQPQPQPVAIPPKAHVAEVPAATPGEIPPIIKPRTTAPAVVQPFADDREFLASTSTPSTTPVPAPVAPTTPVPALPSTLKIVTIPPGLDFRVLRGAYDETESEVLGQGSTPATLENLPAGAGHVEISAPSLGQRSFNVRLTAGETTEFNRSFPYGTVKIQSTPTGAEIFCDDESLGNAPLEIPVLTGPHKFHAERGETESRPQTLTVATDGKHSLTFDFRSPANTTARRPRVRSKKPDPNIFEKAGKSITNFFTGKHR